MRSRGMWLGLVLVAGLAAAAYLLKEKDVERGLRREQDMVFPFNVYRVEEFTLTLGNVRARLERDASRRWVVVDGPEGVDPYFAGDVLGAWSRVRYLETVEEHPESLERFQLAPPIGSLSAVIRPADDGSSPRRTPQIEIGGLSPLAPAVYARLDGFKRVVLVSPSAAEIVLDVGRKLLGLPPLKELEPDESPAREINSPAATPPASP
ncbi:MAG: hypothetical protein JSV80_17545 [Acidobacteriota bacterium]|nr:MAG: hypothetical protein JSV80_17545 [Acidobacteriota bacterium]